MPIKHRFVSEKPDLPDATLINPSDWNATHEVEPGSITTAELADGSVTAAKLAPDVLGVDSRLRAIYGLKMLFKASLSSNHAVLTYSAQGALVQVDVWETADLALKLYTRVCAYNVKGDLLSRTTTDELTGAVLTTTFEYNTKRDVIRVTDSVTL